MSKKPAKTVAEIEPIVSKDIAEVATNLESLLQLVIGESSTKEEVADEIIALIKGLPR